MAVRSIKYYGYDRQTIEDCTELINSTNKKNVLILNVWFFAVNLLCAFFSFMGWFGISRDLTIMYLLYAVVSFIYFFVYKILGKNETSLNILILVMINIFLWMIYGIHISVSQPYMIATFFVVMMVVLAFSFIANMVRTFNLLGLCVAIFVISSFKFKTSAIATRDLYNTIVFMLLSIVLHFAFQRNRIQQFVAMQRNIQIQKELEIKSSFDALTSLLNRGRFFSLAADILGKDHDEYMAICLLDLDEFKQINDKLGHQMGDKAIQITGQIIIDCLEIDMSEKWAFQEQVMANKGSFPGRLGGDEFIILIRGKKNQEEVSEILRNILAQLNAVEVGELHGIHASFGVTEIAPDDRDIDVAYARADEALYESKRAGKNQIAFSSNNKQGG